MQLLACLIAISVSTIFNSLAIASVLRFWPWGSLPWRAMMVLVVLCHIWTVGISLEGVWQARKRGDI